MILTYCIYVTYSAFVGIVITSSVVHASFCSVIFRKSFWPSRKWSEIYEFLKCNQVQVRTGDLKGFLKILIRL